jgi:hypothetical protein
MITYLETFLGESVKFLWEQWVEGNPGLYEELKGQEVTQIILLILFQTSL